MIQLTDVFVNCLGIVGPAISDYNKQLILLSVYIWNDSEVSNHVQDLEPDPDVLGPLGHRPSRLADELLSVQPDLHPVVQEGEEGGEGEGRHEDGDEAEL